jgi:hypothetical protein
MKKILFVWILIALVALLSYQAEAQRLVKTKLNNTGIYYQELEKLVAGVSTAAAFSGVPSTPETSQTFRAPFVFTSLSYSVKDTIRDTVYVDASTDSGTTWNVIATKAVNVTDVASPVWYEEILRDGDSDIVDGVLPLLRVRHTPASAGCGTAGSRASLIVKLNWIP